MQKLLAFLQLCRFAAVFTAMADIVLGYLLTHSGFDSARDFGLLLGASSCLYVAGMVLNDIFDREVDARERPKRPIPSGRVSLRAAVLLGAVLIIAGLVLSFGVGRNSLLLAVLLTACIFLYDGVLKSTLVGPVAMGACRFLNVMLGASAALPFGAGVPSFAGIWALPQLAVGAGLGLYIVGVTWFARQEARTSRRPQLIAAQLMVNLGLAWLMAFVLMSPDELRRSANVALIVGFVGLILNGRLLNAVIDPSPAKVQASIKTMLLSLVMLDASLIFFVQENRLYAFAVALLVIPATLLGRFLAIT